MAHVEACGQARRIEVIDTANDALPCSIYKWPLAVDFFHVRIV